MASVSFGAVLKLHSFKTADFKFLHSFFFFFSTWALCTMSLHCLWKAPDSCSAIACNTSLSLKMFGLGPKGKLKALVLLENLWNFQQPIKERERERVKM